MELKKTRKFKQIYLLAELAKVFNKASIFRVVLDFNVILGKVDSISLVLLRTLNEVYKVKNSFFLYF
jgi:hypothetical protein